MSRINRIKFGISQLINWRKLTAGEVGNPLDFLTVNPQVESSFLSEYAIHSSIQFYISKKILLIGYKL